MTTKYEISNSAYKVDGDKVLIVEEMGNGVWLQSINGFSSCVDFINLSSEHVSVSWNGVHYHYKGVDVVKALAVFYTTDSLGKTANYIKANGQVTFKSQA